MFRALRLAVVLLLLQRTVGLACQARNQAKFPGAII